MKKVMAGLLTGVLLTANLLPVQAETEAETGAAPVETDARSYVLMEQETGEVLAGVNIHEQLEPASVTKVMTMLLVVEALDSGRISTEDQVTTSEYAASMGGSQIYLEPGEVMTVDDLLKSVAVVSANDAAVALAELVSGSETAFVDAMNQKAQELGMEDTHFVNCNGLPAEGHLTSAYDIALMSRELMKHSRIENDTTSWMDSVRGGEFALSNTNKLIKTYSGITGLKTGYTDSAKYCLSATAERDGMGLIATVMGASSSALRFSTASQLLDYGFANYTLVKITPDQALPPVAVRGGEVSSVQSVLEGSPSLLLPKSQAGTVSTSLEMLPEVTAPVEAGDPVGTLVVFVGEEQREKLTLTAQSSVPKLTFSTMFGRLWQRMRMTEG